MSRVSRSGGRLSHAVGVDVLLSRRADAEFLVLNPAGPANYVAGSRGGYVAFGHKREVPGRKVCDALPGLNLDVPVSYRLSLEHGAGQMEAAVFREPRWGNCRRLPRRTLWTTFRLEVNWYRDILVTGVLLFYSSWQFRKMEKSFADIV